MEIYNFDCLDVLRLIRDEEIHLTITSPPYDDLRGYQGLPFDKFKLLAAELFRCTKNGGIVVWNVNDSVIKGSESGTSFRHALYFKKIGFKLHDTMIWNKGHTPYQHSNRYISCFEYMFIFSKGAPKTVNLIKDRRNKHAGKKVHGTERLKDGTTKALSKIQIQKSVKLFGARLNIWEIPSEHSRTGPEKQHPARFPLSIPFDHIRTWSNPTDTIFDPFLGSGTTGVAAYLLNRNFIGAEIEEKYFKIAKHRILIEGNF